MSLIYDKTNWKDDKSTPVNAKNLNNIEDGVEYIYHKWDKIIQDSTTGDHAAELIDARYGPNDVEEYPTLGHRLNHMSLFMEALNKSSAKKEDLPLANVKDFGAKGDGVSDDTKAIQDALNSSKNIYIPEGRYVINDTLNMSFNTSISGDNSTKTVILLGSGLENKYLINYGSTYNYGASKGKISGIKFQSNLNDNCRSLGILLYSSMDLYDVYFYQLKCILSKIANDYIDQIRMDRCTVAYCSGTSNKYVIDVSGPMDAFEINNMHFVDAYTDASDNPTTFSEYRGIRISTSGGGHITNSIINTCVILDNVKGFSISNTHLEGSQHKDYKGNLSYIKITRSKVKLENLYIHKRCNGANILIKTYKTTDTQESNSVILENLFIDTPGYNIGRYNNDIYEVEKDVLTSLKVTNCFVAYNFSSNWTTTNPIVGIRIKDINDFNSHSSYYSYSCMIDLNNTVLNDIPMTREDSSFNNGGVMLYSSSQSKIPWYEEGSSNKTFYITSVFAFDFERKLALFRDTSVHTIQNVTTTSEDIKGSGIQLRNPRAKSTDGIGLELIVYRGETSKNYNKITRIPCCSAYYIFDFGTNIMGIPTHDRDIGDIDNFNYVSKCKTINGGRNVEFYANQAPIYGIFKKYDRCINTNIKSGQTKSWIFDGDSWISEGTY